MPWREVLSFWYNAGVCVPRHRRTDLTYKQQPQRLERVNGEGHTFDDRGCLFVEGSVHRFDDALKLMMAIAQFPDKAVHVVQRAQHFFRCSEPTCEPPFQPRELLLNPQHDTASRMSSIIARATHWPSPTPPHRQTDGRHTTQRVVLRDVDLHAITGSLSPVLLGQPLMAVMLPLFLSPTWRQAIAWERRC